MVVRSRRRRSRSKPTHRRKSRSTKPVKSTRHLRGGAKGKKKSIRNKRNSHKSKALIQKKSKSPRKKSKSPRKKSKSPVPSPSKLTSPDKNCRAQITCFKKFFKDRNQKYDIHLTETAEFLASLGMPCTHLLTVNFSTNEPFNRARSERNDSQILRAYVRDVDHLSADLGSDDYAQRLATQTAMALLHEAYYSILAKPPRGHTKPHKNLGIDEGFAKSQALEMISLDYLSCPMCGGTLGPEHLQHRGDLFCATPGCLVDIDVKTSFTNNKPNHKGSAMGHCLQYNSSNPAVKAKAGITQFVSYIQNLDYQDFSICMINCDTLDKKTGYVETWDCTGPIPYDLLYRVTKMAIAIVLPYTESIRKLDERI
jgi:hypothetical protein